MRHTITAILLLALPLPSSACGGGAEADTASAPRPDPVVTNAKMLGVGYNSTQDTYLSPLHYAGPELRYVSHTIRRRDDSPWLRLIINEGRLAEGESRSENGALLSAARARGTRSVMHLSTLTEEGGFDSERAALVLSDREVQSGLISQLLQTVQARQYAGVDVDFEYIPGEYAAAYGAFLERLHRLLRPMGRFLWAALAPKTSSNQRGLLYEGHDYAAVSAAVDAVLLMTYEWGYTAGPPMAVAPLPNVRSVLDYAVTLIPPEKIMLGVPNYGYDWPLPFVSGVTRAQSLSNEAAIALAVREDVAIQFDEEAVSPFFHYTAGDGTVHEVWFEDARSLEAKFRLMAEYGFLGCGIWNIDRPFAQTWTTLDSLYDVD